MKKLPPIEIKDTRLVKRFERIIQHLFQSTDKSIPRTFLIWKQTRTTYRFISNPRARKEDLNICEYQMTSRTILSVKESVILHAQDTTDISFPGRSNIPD